MGCTQTAPQLAEDVLHRIQYADAALRPIALDIIDCQQVPGAVELVELLEYIADHLFENGLDANSVLTACGVTNIRITLRFADFLERSIDSYIHSHRILVAERLLTETGLEIVAIASILGYTDVEDFDCRFGEETGMPSDQYRRQLRGKSRGQSLASQFC